MTKDEILHLIHQHLDDVTLGLETDFDPALTMKDMGADSMDIVEVVSRTMRELRVRIPHEELNEIENIDQLADAMLRAYNAKQIRR